MTSALSVPFGRSSRTRPIVSSARHMLTGRSGATLACSPAATLRRAAASLPCMPSEERA
jgi:hypothetical protein